ncbi:DmpA family aminopeptidase [Adhaeribacter pallidiroseus]|uniref:D-stereospecific aminopeptidase n=1 Tax=Adhaeribacter pallidiroseus TaxID=2072847 RepID=A0A369QLH0_9BACT|nr:P1 family peptidase [Adhaeribacter pallidiroseus]RDC65554.1 D-stereospecific aminopeptidase [Adhaeribacter pallidiroseus]
MVPFSKICFVFGILLLVGSVRAQERKRAREYGLKIGILPTGKNNAITDVPGVKVGHTTLIQGENIRTGVTAIVPHAGNLFQEKVPAAVYVGNGFGKLAGSTQVQELGNLETPIVLTNTLSVANALNALVSYSLQLPGNEKVQSVNAVVGETNDGYLNDIRGRHITEAHAREAIQQAKEGPVAEGNVGAGTGTVCFGFKGGIGTASRQLKPEQGSYTVGVLVQTNFGGVLQINGVPMGEELKNYLNEQMQAKADGSCLIVVATDAPVEARNLERIAKRALLGLGKTGGIAANGSGDYVIAFSTHPNLRISHNSAEKTQTVTLLRNDDVTPLFLATIEATEEAILNSLFKAETLTGREQHRIPALPIEQTLKILKKHHALQP